MRVRQPDQRRCHALSWLTPGVCRLAMDGPHRDTHGASMAEGVHLLPGGVWRLAEHRDDYRCWVPAPLGRQEVQALPAGVHLVRGDAVRQLLVGIPRHTLEPSGRMATQQNRRMGFVRRFGIVTDREKS